MKRGVLFLILLFSHEAKAQAFVGVGNGINFYEREVIGEFSIYGIAGIYAKDNEKFHCGFALTAQRHSYGGRLTTYAGLGSVTQRKLGEQSGITPAVFIGPTIDQHLSFGVMAGYEIFASEQYIEITTPPYHVTDFQKYKFEHGRVSANVYANVKMFQGTRLTPMIHARYGLLFDRHSTVQEISLTLCMLYRWQHKSAVTN